MKRPEHRFVPLAGLVLAVAGLLAISAAFGPVQTDAHTLAAQQNVDEQLIRRLLSSAVTVLNFEPGAYALDDEAGFVLHRDLGPGDRYGRFEGPAEFSQGIAGQAYQMGEKPCAMRLPTVRPVISNTASQLTISFWHKMASQRAAYLFCCGIPKRRSISIVMLDNGHLEIAFAGSTLTTKKPVYTEDWQHLALVFDDTDLRLYADGDEFDAWTFASKVLDAQTIGAASTYLGAMSVFNSQRNRQLYQGLIDEVTILPHAASVDEIRQLHNWTKAGNVLPELEDDAELVEGIAHGVPDEHVSSVNFMEEFPITAASRYQAVTEILESAVSIFNFEEGTYSRDRDSTNLAIQDLGPGDNWALCTGGDRFVSGIAGQGFGFDGIQRSLVLPTMHSEIVDGRKAFTISFWHRPGSQKNGVIFDCGAYPRASLAVVMRGDLHYQINIGNAATLVSSRSYWTDQWQHFAFAFEESLVKMYVDGHLKESWLIPATALNGKVVGGDSAGFGIQAAESPDRAERFYHGFLDEVAMLSRAASDDEILQLYEWTLEGLPLPRIPDDPKLVTSSPAHGEPWEIPLALKPGLPPQAAPPSAVEVARDDPRAAKVTKLVRDALAIYTFEPGATVKVTEPAQTHVQDWGETDNYGAAVGTVAFEDGLAGRAMVFDGTSTAIVLPTMPALLSNGRTELTLSFWHRSTSQEGKRMLFNCGFYEGDGFFIRYSPTQRYTLCAGGDNWMGTEGPQWTDKWRHVVVVFAGSQVDLYLDGQRTESWQIPNTALNKASVGSARTTIGRNTYTRSDRDRQYFQGLIDEFAILPNAITAEDARLLFEWGRDGRPLPLIPDDANLLKGPPHGVRQSP